MRKITVPAAATGLPSLIRRSALGEAGGAIFEPSVFTLGEQRLIKRAMALVEGKCLRAGPILDSYDVLERYLVLRFAGLTNEQFHVLYLDVTCRLLEARTEFFGHQGHVKVDIRQIAPHAIVLGAEYVAFVHNHPSGTPSPSEDDLQFTTQTETTLHNLGIKLLDSFVVTSRGVTSINAVRRRNREERHHRVQVELARLKIKRRLKREAEKANGQPLPEPKTSPMIAQYLEIKEAHRDALLFYRMGDFYELFFEDAEVAAEALGIVLTRRGKHAGEDIPMCGVPVEHAEDYLHRLIGLGHRVAVCEQFEDSVKSVVRREVRRLASPSSWLTPPT